MITNTLNNLVADFSVGKLKQFLIQKIDSLKPDEEDYEYLFEDNTYITENYKNIIKIGEADLSNVDDLIVIAVKTLSQLTNRTGKKRQFEIAKKILKEENKDAAFFIFYDDDGSFRFSFIKANFLGVRRKFTDFKRFTYFVSRKLTNKTFKSQILKADFNDLASIQEAFNVEPITKQFYEKLQHWYFWAIKNVKFPDDAEQEPNGRKIAIIRLITRLMFIWFMKVRNLIPDDLFDENKIKEILKDCSDEQSTYYKVVLQNLFFATLNTKQSERKFRSETRGAKGYNPDFGNHNVYRYHDLFKEGESFEALFGKIPFLNGGLFECLDYKTKEKSERKYIDGFTAIKGQQPKVPNFLFFAEIQKVDLSDFFGTSNKTYETQGLINLLKSYNFTIDENEPDDVEVALDPELLGSIFENLLASYNPETTTTARKATGSFYTPREIVSYMTSESLKQYFLLHLKNENIDNVKNKLSELVTGRNAENPFDRAVAGRLINLINDLRVVDPAVGSGAFPMAMLNQLVFILGKLDPDNTFWKQSQIDGIVKSVSDPTLQKRLIDEVERRFKEKNADYGRKLYLIEKCLYGVDIQQIAVEIAKLRFFISLLVDEKIDFDRPENNCNIEPLPNLDFKIMQGNSLISTFAGIDFNVVKKPAEDLFSDTYDPYRQLIKEFEDLKNQYQNESDRENKIHLRDKIDKIIIKIFEERINPYLPELKAIKEIAKQFPTEKQRRDYTAEEERKLTKKRGFDIGQAKRDLIAYTEGRKPKDFFLWNIYFAEVFTRENGFDIVIGNPPYGAKISKNQLKIIKSKLKDTGNSNSAALFVDRAKNLLTNKKGILSFIVPKSLLYSEKWFSLAKSLSMHTPVLADVEVAFDNVLLEQVVFVFNKINKVYTYNTYKFKDGKFYFRASLEQSSVDVFKALICDVSINEYKIASKIKIKKIIELGNISITKRGIGLQKYLQSSGDVAIIGGKEISRYKINGIKGFLSKDILNKKNKKLKFLQRTKIVSQDLIAHIQQPIPHIKIVSMIDISGILIGMDTVQNTIIENKDYSEKYILSLLNSKLVNWYTHKFIYCSAIRTMHFDNYYIGKIPISKISKPQQKPFEELVDVIITKKERGEDTAVEERRIDQMVYKLYELTDEEIKIIERNA